MGWSKVRVTKDPVFEGLGTAPAEGLTAEDIYTNEFIDTSIGLE